MIAPLAYLDTGSPPGRLPPALVLVHGDFSSGVHTWSNQIRELKERFRVVAVDRSGHGRSRRRPGPYTFRRDAEELIATIRSLGISRPHLVGHSYGALVALEAVRCDPGVAASLHLVEAPYLSLLPDHPDAARLRTESGAARRLAGDRDETAFAFFKAVIGEEGAEHLRRRRAWSMILQDVDRLVQEEFAGEYPADAVRSLPTLPVFVYAGGRSHPGLKAVSLRLASLLSAVYEEFPEAGHDVPKSAPAFTRALGSRVDSLARSPVR